MRINLFATNPTAVRVGLLAALCLLGACGQSGAPAADTTPDKQPAAKPVRVAAIQRNDAARVFSLTGITRAASRAELSFQVSGRLRKRPVNIGDTVEKGDLIALLTQPELGAAAEAAKASVRQLETKRAQAKRDLARAKKLAAQDAATEQQLEQARAQYQTLSERVAQARASSKRATSRAAKLRIEAPLAGTVKQINYEPGEYVPAGRAVVALSGEHALEVAIGVPERLLDDIAPGDKARLTLALFDNRRLTGTVTHLASAAEGAGQLFTAIITLDSAAGLRAGLSVNWRVKAAPSHRLLAPAEAVASPGGTDAPRVYRVKNARARAVPVELGEIIGENVQVSGQLEPGDRIVTQGLNNLTDGRRVRVLDD